MAITVYGTPWCPDCKRAKQFLGEHRVMFTWVDVDEDPEGLRYVQEANQGKSIIPTIVFDDGSLLVEPTNAELAQKLGLQVKANRTYYDLIVVGGGPAGLAAALYAAREGIETLVIERSALGGQAGVTERIENYPGFPEGLTGADLAQRLADHARRYDVEMLQAQAVKQIESQDAYRIVRTEGGDEYCARALLLVPGTRYRRLNVPGEEDFIGAGIHFCATCDGPFYKGQELVVVGGGNSGLEEGLFLTKFASKVTVLEAMDKLGASQILQEKALGHPKMEIRTGVTVQEFKGDTRLRSLVVKDLSSGATEELAPGGAFIFIGLDPNTDFLKGSVETDPRGFISTGDNLETSMPGVFAAGDARAGSTKQVVSAAGEGATAALMIRGYLEKQGDANPHSSD